MADHFYPHLDGITDNSKLINYVNTPELFDYAQQGIDLLSKFPELTVWKVQCKHPSRMKNNAWYVGFVDKEDPFLMNFTIIPSNLNVEFRFSQYLPEKGFEKLKWQTKNWRCADIKSYDYKFILNLIEGYIGNIKNDVYSDKLRSGGRSFVEEFIYRDLKSIYPNIHIERNKRPDELRSDKDKPLELDLFIPELSVAIEVQGPQHFREVYGDNSRLKINDKVKINWCKENGVKMIWVDWEKYNENMLRETKNTRIKLMKNQLNTYYESKEPFFMWQW